MKRISSALLIGLVVCLQAGCRTEPEVSFRKWHTPKPSEASERSETYELYVAAADRAAQIAPNSVKRSTFSPGDQKQLIAQLAPVLKDVERATRGTCRYASGVPRSLDDARRTEAWMLIGRTIAWRVEQAVAGGDFDAAVSWCLVGTKMGLDLAQGGRTESSLGLAVASNARKALAPHLGRLSPAHLDRLATRLAAIASDAVPRSVAIETEGRHMMYFVQWVQDCYIKSDWPTLERAMYRDGREAIDYLRGMDRAEAPKYFEGMADEAEAITANLLSNAKLPVAERIDIDWDEKPNRPWKRISKHFFRFAETLLAIGDEFDARQRMFILQARVLSQIKKSGAAPATLPGKTDLSTDPFSGEPFVYRATGKDFVLYSVGSDLRDDGGDTDEAGLRPDLRLDDGMY